MKMKYVGLDNPTSVFLFLLVLAIVSDHGISHQKSSTSRQRWIQYETALSNTGPLGGTLASVPLNVTTSNPTIITSPTTPVPPTTITTTVISSTTTTRKGSASGIISSYNTNRNNYFGPGRRRTLTVPLSLDGFPDGALFENNTSVNITVPVGDTAFLRCRVKNLGERSISWIRRRDWHILTTGKITYTNDGRFNVLHTEGTEDWILQIKFVQERDAGQYECQISTGTGIISFIVNLTIAVPEAFILGNGDEYHVEQGSTINLVCVIEKLSKLPEYLFWFHNERRIINLDGSLREVSIKTEPGVRTQSRLTIRDARIPDSGNYTCMIPNASPASIFVYVSQASGLFSGDKIAAIQRRTDGNSQPIAASTSTTTIYPQVVLSAITITLGAMTSFSTTTMFAL